ncbi:MAG: acyl-CoA dehydrogenase family protein, partial [Planctomycetes bacterium]|nr:acyl-CoA dehydrogenase family protein [Planctomycetota bacterium]
MLSFDLDERLAKAQAEARQFAIEHVAPGAAARDRDKIFPHDLVRDAAARGWLGCLVPEAQGGSGLGNIGQAIVLEEIAAACASTHVTISVHNSLVCSPILSYGSERQKELYLRRVATGESLGAYLLTEAGSGSDAAAMKTTARLEDGEWILNGEKMWITTGDEAKLGIVFARSEADPKLANTKAISAFLVPFNRDGIQFGKREEKLGLRGSSTVSVTLNEVRVPEDHLMGERARGFNVAMDMLNGGRIGIAVQGVGIARAALEYALSEAAGRERDGRPLSRSQLAVFRLSEIATEIDAARLLSWRAAILRDQKRNHIREASMAKLFATQAANRACRAVVGLLGEAGYDDQSVAARLMRDVRVTELYEGTTEVQKLVIGK